jgi:hypothetical protein
MQKLQAAVYDRRLESLHFSRGKLTLRGSPRCK